eukprot:scaffold281129_cov40-Tisochrysis_lutea.AAC.3
MLDAHLIDGAARLLAPGVHAVNTCNAAVRHMLTWSVSTHDSCGSSLPSAWNMGTILNTVEAGSTSGSLNRRERRRS